MTFRTRSRVRSAGRTLPRPHTALGLTGSSTRRTSHSQSLAGFDVHEYFRQNGPGAELTVGVNGQPSRDQALLNYVQKCKAEALLDATEDARVRVDDSNSVQGATHSPGRHVPVQRVPLCWDSTLHETEVYIILCCTLLYWSTTVLYPSCVYIGKNDKSSISVQEKATDGSSSVKTSCSKSKTEHMLTHFLSSGNE